MQAKTRKLYRTYLLRCWQAGESRPDQKPIWRFSVEKILDERQRQGFGSLEEVVAFLQTELNDFGEELLKKERIGSNPDDTN